MGYKIGKQYGSALILCAILRPKLRPKKGLKDVKKLASRYTAPISKFKANPANHIEQARGEPVAVMSHNEVQFYAVPAELFEDMTDFCEYAQRGTTELASKPARFQPADMANIAESNAKALQGGTEEPGEDDVIGC